MSNLSIDNLGGTPHHRTVDESKIKKAANELEKKLFKTFLTHMIKENALIKESHHGQLMHSFLIESLSETTSSCLKLKNVFVENMKKMQGGNAHA